MLLLLVVAVIQAPSSEVPDAGQFLRLVKGLHSEVRDVSFVFEGGVRLVGPENIVGKQEVPHGNQFQGAFSYRAADGATLVDSYQISLAPDVPVARVKLSLLKGNLHELALIPDAGVRDTKPEKSAGAPGSMSRDGSPNRFLFHWYFQALSEADLPKIHTRGWEVLDGHRCLVVNVVASEGKNGLSHRFWVDLERGGNVLKFEGYSGANLRYRTRDIKLNKFMAGAKEVWLPVGGTVDTFMWGSDYRDVPIYRETYAVVNGSVILNAGLSDADFSVTKRDRSAGELDKLELSARYREAMSRPPPDPMRTDPPSVRERIDAQLAEADRQAKMLEASAPSRESWSWVGAVQVTVAVAAVALIVTALMMRRRAS